MTEEEALDLILNTLQSINEFDVEYVSKLMGMYLLFFSFGFIAGTVIKTMKRA